MNKSVTTLGLIFLVVLFVVPSFGQLTPITIDGDSADWVGLPAGVAINNPPGYFPGGDGGVNAMVNDTCDLRYAQVAVDDGKLYFFLRMWADDAWPNFAYREIRSGVPSVRSRGYYHILLDLDNDRSTGWDPAAFEAHYTTLGYLMSDAGDETYPATSSIGCELMAEVGISCTWSNEETRDPVNAGHVPSSISYWGADYSQYNGWLDIGSEADMFDLEVQSVVDSLTYQHGVMSTLDSIMTPAGSSAPGVDTLGYYFGGHAWSGPFVEVGMSYKMIVDYYLACPDYEEQFFQDGQTIAFVGHIETPMDDWGVDTGPRGEYTIPTGGGVPSSIENNAGPTVITEFALENNYPNPFNPVTTIKYQTPKSADVSLVIYNALGQQVRMLVNGTVEQGTHSVTWNGRNEMGKVVPSGIYFYVLNTGDTQISKKMVLMK